MSKSKEELNELKENVEALNKKLQELTPEERKQVVGGARSDNMAAGPASYGMTDTLGRMHSDAQFA